MAGNGADELPKSSQVLDGRIVEANWNCKLANSVLADLKPRVRLQDGILAGNDHQDMKRLPVRGWAKIFTHELAALSKIADMSFGHEKLFEQRDSRHLQRQNPQQNASELLTSDIRATILEINRLISAGRYKISTREEGVAEG